jgi:transcription antitermination factor NusG
MTQNRFVPEVDRWIALRTSARWEKKICDRLSEFEVPVFLPLMSRIVEYATKRRTSEIPLFTGYVFCSEKDFIGNSRIPKPLRKQVSQVLRPTDYRSLHQELQSISQLIQSHKLVQEKLYGIPGERVRIIGGSFVGMEGEILKLKPNKRVLIIEVSFLNAKLEVEIEEHLVEKA